MKTLILQASLNKSVKSYKFSVFYVFFIKGDTIEVIIPRELLVQGRYKVDFQLDQSYYLRGFALAENWQRSSVSVHPYTIVLLRQTEILKWWPLAFRDRVVTPFPATLHPPLCEG